MKKPVIGVTSALDEKGDVILRRIYCLSLMQSGGIPVILPPYGDPAAALSSCDGILFSGGGDISPERFGIQKYNPETIRDVSPERDAYELALAKLAYLSGVPTLGICRGIQIMNVALGGTLHLDISAHHQTSARTLPHHPISILPKTQLAALIPHATIAVNSLHHQAVDRVSERMQISAVAEDGVIEALEAPMKRFFIGIQWHPEDLSSREAGTIIAALVLAAQQSR